MITNICCGQIIHKNSECRISPRRLSLLFPDTEQLFRFDKLSLATFDYNMMTAHRILSSPPPPSLEYLLVLLSMSTSFLHFVLLDSSGLNDWSLSTINRRYGRGRTPDLKRFSSKFSHIGVELTMLPSLREMQLHIPFPLESDMDAITSLGHFLRTGPRTQMKDLK